MGNNYKTIAIERHSPSVLAWKVLGRSISGLFPNITLQNGDLNLGDFLKWTEAECLLNYYTFLNGKEQ